MFQNLKPEYFEITSREPRRGRCLSPLSTEVLPADVLVHDDPLEDSIGARVANRSRRTGRRTFKHLFKRDLAQERHRSGGRPMLRFIAYKKWHAYKEALEPQQIILSVLAQQSAQSSLSSTTPSDVASETLDASTNTPQRAETPLPPSEFPSSEPPPSEGSPYVEFPQCQRAGTPPPSSKLPSSEPPLLEGSPYVECPQSPRVERTLPSSEPPSSEWPPHIESPQPIRDTHAWWTRQLNKARATPQTPDAFPAGSECRINSIQDPRTRDVMRAENADLRRELRNQDDQLSHTTLELERAKQELTALHQRDSDCARIEQGHMELRRQNRRLAEANARKDQALQDAAERGRNIPPHLGRQALEIANLNAQLDAEKALKNKALEKAVELDVDLEFYENRTAEVEEKLEKAESKLEELQVENDMLRSKCADYGICRTWDVDPDAQPKDRINKTEDGAAEPSEDVQATSGGNAFPASSTLGSDKADESSPQSTTRTLSLPTFGTSFKRVRFQLDEPTTQASDTDAAFAEPDVPLSDLQSQQTPSLSNQENGVATASLERSLSVLATGCRIPQKRKAGAENCTSL